MPFTPQQQDKGIFLPIGQPREPAPEEDKKTNRTAKEFFTEVIPAAFKQENPVVSLTQEATANLLTSDKVDDNYNVFEDIKGYEEYADNFIDVVNPDQASLRKAQIDSEKENKRVLDEYGGFGTLAVFSAALMDPTNLIPAGQAARSIKGGYSLLATGGKTAAAGFVASSISEAALQAGQQTRTIEESALNIAGTTFLSGVLGAGYAKLLNVGENAKLLKLAEGLEKEMSVPIDPDAPESILRSVGAAQPGTTMKQETLKKAFGLEKIQITPMLRAFNSPSKVWREVSQKLIENSLYFNKNAEGIPTDQAVETLMKEYKAGLSKSFVDLREIFKEYKAAQKKEGLDNITFFEFKEKVSSAMRRNDKDATNPFVEKAAKSFRSNVFDPLKEKAIQNELLPKDVSVETAPSYLMRMWNIQKVVAKEPEFRAIVSDWVRGEASKALYSFDKGVSREIGKQKFKLQEIQDQQKRIVAFQQKLEETLLAQSQAPEGLKFDQLRELNDVLKKPAKKGSADVKRKMADIERFLGEINISSKAIDLTNPFIKKVNQLKKQAKKLREQIKAKTEISAEKRQMIFDVKNDFEGYVQDVTDEIVDTLKGIDSLTQPYDITVKARGPLKERTFNIPDALIEDFLQNDIEHLAERYTRVLGADVELKGKFGSVTMQDQIKKINEEYSFLAARTTTEKERKALEKRRKNDIRDLNAMRDLVRGTYRKFDDPDNIWVRSGEMARHLNFLQKLGGVTVSSFPDVARLSMRHGFRVFDDLIGPAIKNIKAVKMSVAEAKLAGQVTETVLNGRVASFAEISDPYAKRTAFERFVANMSRGFSKLTLMSYWNNLMKSSASVITQNRILKNSADLAAGKSLPQKEIEYMAMLGLDEGRSKAIAEQFKKHGDIEDNIRLAGTANWDDGELVKMYRAAINKDVDSIIVTPGAGDLPLIYQTAVGKTLLQFKSFMFASNQRIMLSGIQQGDAAALVGMVTSIGMGMAVYAFKTIEAGKELSDDPAVWVLEGVDRSGIIPVLMEANNIGDKVGFGIGSLTGVSPVSRYASRNLAGALAGPTAGLINDLGVVLGATSSSLTGNGKFTQNDLRTLRRLLPYNNLIAVRYLFDEVEKGAGETFNLPKKKEGSK